MSYRKLRLLLWVFFAAFCLLWVIQWMLAGTAKAQSAMDTNNAGLVEYRMVGNCSISLEQVLDLFIPSLSGGKKFLSPRVNGLGLIHRWNSQLAGATWSSKLQPGDTIRLPAEWVLRGIQNVLEPAEMPLLLPSGATQAEGDQLWLLVFILAAGGGIVVFLAGGLNIFFHIPRSS